MYVSNMKLVDCFSHFINSKYKNAKAWYSKQEHILTLTLHTRKLIKTFMEKLMKYVFTPSNWVINITKWYAHNFL